MSPGARIAIRRTLQLGAIFLAIHFLLPLLGGLRSSLRVISHANPLLVLAAVGLQAASLVAYGQCARTLLPPERRIGLLPVLRVQLAMLALTHVLPGGGAAATPLGYRLYRRSGVPAGDAGFVLGLQGIGSAVVLNVMYALVLIGSVPFRGIRPTDFAALAIGAVLLLILAFLLVSAWTRAGWVRALEVRLARLVPASRRDGLRHVREELTDNLGRLREDPKTGAAAAGWAAAQWALDCSSLYVFLIAFGAVAPPDVVFVAFGLSQILALLPITPGGLGLFEAVLSSSLVGFGIRSASVVVTVLAYRLAEFWLPIPVGLVGYLTVRPGPDEADEPADAQIPGD